jgi:tight adherence protein C
MNPLALLDDPIIVTRLAVIGSVILVLVLVATWMSARAGAERRLMGRVSGVGAGEREASRDRGRGSLAGGVLRAIGNALSGTALLSEKDRRDLENTVAAAGYRPQAVVPVVIGLKVVLLLALPAAAYGFTVLRGIEGLNRLVAILVAAALGLLGPNMVLGVMHRRYVAQVRAGLADALDLMVICSEAGLGLESMVERVAMEMGPSNGPVAAEFSALSNELRLLADRRQALLNLGARTDVEGLKRLATTLAQTIQYGTPLAQAMRTLAAEMRQERLTQFEGKATRLPALLVLPLTLFILPCLVLLLAGPSFVQLFATFPR